jgi:arylsulfatase A-like enzyme
LPIWCGLIAGLLEVSTIVLRKQVIGANRFYGMSRYFAWLIPATDTLIFLILGVVLWPVVLWPARGRRLLALLFGALTPLPALLVAVPEVYTLAWLILTLGFASLAAPVLERHAASLARWAGISLPFLAGLVIMAAAYLCVGDWLRERREAARPLPAPGSPNLLWIVLDTVGADHLSLHGYAPRTGATLEELAGRGIRFDRAQATAPWTLPSHASMFTGFWPHELSAGWMQPLDAARPTVAEDLGGRGYATAGFVANRFYCGWESGLARGFAHYEDHALPRLGAFRLAALVDRSLVGLRWLDRVRRGLPGFDRTPQIEAAIIDLFNGGDRKDAAEVNREFLAWLAGRRQPDRPFFAFLNYFDAHHPYLVPADHLHRFCDRPKDAYEWDLIENWRTADKTRLTPREIQYTRDSHDSCIADLDEQLGMLLDDLEERGALDHTWVIITSDHGESFGEHGGFGHGGSLYQTELHVPLLILPPARQRLTRVVAQTASLRNLPATVVDLLGLEAGSPFPGESLARLWEAPSPAEALSDRAISEVAPTDPFDPNRLQLPDFQDPMASLAEGDWVLIRHESGGDEELFDIRADPKEMHNLAGDPAVRARLVQMRAALERLTSGLLTLERLKR